MHLNYIYQWAARHIQVCVAALTARLSSVPNISMLGWLLCCVVSDACVDCNVTKRQDKFLTNVNTYGKSNYTYSDSEPDLNQLTFSLCLMIALQSFLKQYFIISRQV